MSSTEGYHSDSKGDETPRTTNADDELSDKPLPVREGMAGCETSSDQGPSGQSKQHLQYHDGRVFNYGTAGNLSTGEYHSGNMDTTVDDQHLEKQQQGTGSTSTGAGQTGGMAQKSNVARDDQGNQDTSNVAVTNNIFHIYNNGSETTYEKRNQENSPDNSTVIGHTKMINLTITLSKKKSFAIISDILRILEKAGLNEIDGVQDVDFRIGSIIVKFTMTEGFVVTENWIDTMLRLIFDDILGSYLAEGLTFVVHVENHIINLNRQKTYQSRNDSLYGLTGNVTAGAPRPSGPSEQRQPNIKCRPHDLMSTHHQFEQMPTTDFDMVTVETTPFKEQRLGDRQQGNMSSTEGYHSDSKSGAPKIKDLLETGSDDETSYLRSGRSDVHGANAVPENFHYGTQGMQASHWTPQMGMEAQMAIVSANGGPPIALEDTVTQFAERQTVAAYTMNHINAHKFTEYKVENSPNAVVAEKIIVNQTVVNEERSPLSKIRELTNRKLDKFDLEAFYETQATKVAIRCLKSGTAFIEGPEKSGKTSIAWYIMKQYSKEFTPVLISKAKELQKLTMIKEETEQKEDETKQRKMQKPFLIFIDNIFRLQDIHLYLQDLMELIQEGDAHLIVTANTKELRKVKRNTDLGEILKERYRVRLWDYPLVDHERYEIVKQKSKRLGLLRRIKGKEHFLQKIAMSSDYPWFLGILDDPEYPTLGSADALLAFFKYPTRFVVKQIRELYEDEKDKYLALVIIMKQGYLEERSLKSPESPKSPGAMEVYFSLAPMLGIQMPSPTKIKDSAREMVGEYLVFTSKRFVFIHDCVKEAVCQVLFEVSPELFIKWAPLPFLVNNTQTIEREEEEKMLLDDPEQKELLKERFLKENDVMEVLKNDGFSDPEFVRSIIKDLKIDSHQYKEILLQAVTLNHLALVQEILKNILRTLPEGGDSIKYLALEKACEVGNFDAYEELIKIGVEPNLPCMRACHHGRSRKIISKLLEACSSTFCQLSHNAIKEWITLVADVGSLRMIQELFERIQGRQDRLQLIAAALEHIVISGNYDKYHFTVGESEVDTLDWGNLIIAAARGGHEEILKDALNHINNQDISIIKNAFVAACKSNQKVSAEILLKINPDLVLMVTTKDETPLHLAAGTDHNEDPKLLKVLLQKKKDWDINKQDINGSTALHSACHIGNFAAAEALMKAGFNPNSLDNDQNTPLHVHLKGKFINKPLVNKLLGLEDFEEQRQVEASLNVQNVDRNTPLHLFCLKLRAVHVSILQTLVQNGGKAVNQVNRLGQTPLHVLIASGGSSQTVEYLLGHGSDLAVHDNEGQTALHLACKGGNDVIIKKLLKHWKPFKAVLQHTNRQGETPLHCYASNTGNKETVKFLISKENINTKDIEEQTALHMAVKVSGNMEVVESLINNGAYKNAEDKEGKTPLHVLCGVSLMYSDTAELLLRKGTNVQAKDFNQRTPLHHACLSFGHKSLELVKTLLSNNANILDEDVGGNTAVHSCCSVCNHQSDKLLEHLLAYLKMKGQRQNLNLVEQALSARDENGDTPLHKVCLSRGSNMRGVANILINEGADVSLTNNDRDTVMDISRRNRIYDITQLMMETTLINACKDKQKLQNVERILTFELEPDSNNEERLSEMLQTVVQIDGPFTQSVLEIIISKGADVKYRTSEGYTVIHLAAMTQGEFTDHIIDYLISKGADVSDKDHEGETALHKVSTGETKFSATLIKALVNSRGICVKDTDDMGNNPLHKLFAGKLNKYYRECMEELIVLQCDVYSQNSQHKTPCDLAKMHGKRVIGELFETYCTKLRVLNRNPLMHLLYCGADINSIDSEGNTVLHKVCMKRVSFVCNNVNLLLQAGADRTIYNNKGRSAFDLACETGLDEDVRLLTVIEMPDDLENDGASGASTPLYSPKSPQPLPCPEWFRRSSSTESWEGDLRSGMEGIRNAAGMRHFDDQMNDFEQNSRLKMKTFFKRNL